jgi:serine/threonine protein kinase
LTREQHPHSPSVEPRPVATVRDSSTESTAQPPITVVLTAEDAYEVHGPERFGRYVLLERLGEGGMAEVFRAVVPGAEGFRRQVVLKRILASHASAPAFVEMFAQEARISALLHHPNIVQVFDFGQVDGSYFLAMELLEGWEVGAINKALRAARAKMPIEIAVHIAHEVLLGLSYAHTLKVQGHEPHIVHRDVSPSNIMCLRTGGVKLLDFGVASTTGAAASTGGGTKPAFCGKLSYAAPEYVQGQGQDARIDLFAVGVILWEMLVGERLFRGSSDQKTLAALLSGTVLPPSAKRPAVPTEIDRIVMKALQRNPAARYQSAASMAEDLEQVLSQRRYQSQMLPRLLGNLFGEDASGPASVTGVEELLQSGSTIPPAPPVPEPARAPVSSGWALRFLGGVGAALVVLGCVFAATSSRLLRPNRRAPPAVVSAVVVSVPGTAPRAPIVVPVIRTQVTGPARKALPAPAPTASATAQEPRQAATHAQAPAGQPAIGPLPREPPSPSPLPPTPTIVTVSAPTPPIAPERRAKVPATTKRMAAPGARRTHGPSPTGVDSIGGGQPVDPFARSASRPQLSRPTRR